MLESQVRSLKEQLFKNIKNVEELKRIDKEAKQRIIEHQLGVELPLTFFSLIQFCNKHCIGKLGIGPFFNKNMEIAGAISRECQNESDFKVKIGYLAGLFEIPLDKLKEKVGNIGESWKSITLLQHFLGNQGIQYEESMFQVWRDIIEFRNKQFPYHTTDERIVQLCEKYQKFPPDYPTLWYAIMDAFNESLVNFYRLLRTYNK